MISDPAPRVTADKALAIVLAQRPRLIGIDGLPCSGKSTLALKIAEQGGYRYLGLDDFVIPEPQWPKPHVPDFPFPYIRHTAFFDAIRTLTRNEACEYRRFDWRIFATEQAPSVIPAGTSVVVEGVSTLAPETASLFDLRIFVESDRATTLDAAIARGAGNWTDHWRNYFMPSADIYLETDPASRADVLVRGRGA